MKFWPFRTRSNAYPWRDISNEKLGRWTRGALEAMADRPGNNIKDIGVCASALFIVGVANENKTDTLSISLGGCTVSDSEIGDWVVTARKNEPSQGGGKQ